MKFLLPFLSFLLVASCSTTPVPTGDRIVSVSWSNQSPTSYSLIETGFCTETQQLTVEDLAAYSEKAVNVSFPLTHNCRITLFPVIGTTPLQKLSSWVPEPMETSPNREYHVQIQVFPNAPPRLRLETAKAARQRIRSAGRSFESLPLKRD